MPPRASALLLAAALLLAGCGDKPDLTITVRGTPIARDAYVRPFGAALRVDVARDDATYLRTFVSTFTSVTPENAMKWETVQPKRGEWDFRAADAVVELAERTRKRVRGHPLVWELQLPEWLTKERWSRAEFEGVLRQHIATLVGRYRGRVEAWDVVNEPFDAHGRWKQTIFYRVLGEDYVRIAFQAAHEADPGARLFLNEIAAERSGPKQRALLALARRLKADDIPIDGVGIQNHTTVEDAPDRARLAELMGRIGELGLDAEITEMDVVGDGEGQVRAYGAAAQACAQMRNCTGLTVWGVTDPYSWKGAGADALLFDRAGHAKPALQAVTGALR